MGYGINGNGLILCPHVNLDKRLLAAVSNQRSLSPIKPYILSIDHKLNVARYSAGLINAMKPEDYGWHRFKRGRKGLRRLRPTKAEYENRCVYYAHDWEQYSLGLLFSIESLAASSFSLFDSCGYLLVELFNLTLPRNETRPDPHNPGKTKTIHLESSFINAVGDLGTQGATNLFNFLNQYRPGNSSSLPWVGNLKKLRNHTTHSQVSDIVELRTPTPLNTEDIWLFGRIFGSSQPDVLLKDFANDCFNGLEDFVDQFYDKLATLVEAEKSIPLSVGRFDNLV